MCFQKKLISPVCQKDQGLSSIKISGNISFATKKKQQNRLQKQIFKGGKKLVPCYPGMAIATPCHPMPPHATPCHLMDTGVIYALFTVLL